MARKSTEQQDKVLMPGDALTDELSKSEIKERKDQEEIDNPPKPRPPSLFDVKKANKAKKIEPPKEPDPIDAQLEDALNAPLDAEYQAEFDQVVSVVTHWADKHSLLAAQAGNRSLSKDMLVVKNAMNHVVKRNNGKPYWK